MNGISITGTFLIEDNEVACIADFVTFLENQGIHVDVFVPQGQGSQFVFKLRKKTPDELAEEELLHD